jgi:hypothetical protein
MAEPLRKRRKDGKPYKRRHAVEKELTEFEKVALPEVLAIARQREQQGQCLVSSEALVYFLRREARKGNADGPGVGGLIAILTGRAERTLRRHIRDAFDEFQTEEICSEVIDRLVDEISDPGNRADYAEVNFNDWLAHNRDDACRKQRRKAARMERLGDAVENLAEGEGQIMPGGRIVDTTSADPTPPETAYALAQAGENAQLPPQIAAGEFSPEDQYRIAAIVRKAKLDPSVLEAFLLYHYLGMAIDSKDPDKHTLVKHFGKSEKTIRLWIGRAAEAFTRLRGETNESETEEPSEPGLGAARLPR